MMVIDQPLHNENPIAGYGAQAQDAALQPRRLSAGAFKCYGDSCLPAEKMARLLETWDDG